MTAKRKKQDWPAGEWQQEPDEKRWEHRGTGLECLMLRGPVGAWCGYVGVRDGHPAYGMHGNVTDYSIEEVAAGLDKRKVAIHTKINDLKVHGGLTYSGTDEKRGKDRWWFGFDCAHAGDFCPACEDIAQLGLPTGWGDVISYRNLAYVIEQCEQLADQLGRVTP